ncbi:MAG: hypothetical protein OXT67_06305 [Zetaproteobacteria bacterium]|nr:hypothetical protein [Zetaproteobacteria bacterium]
MNLERLSLHVVSIAFVWVLGIIWVVLLPSSDHLQSGQGSLAVSVTRVLQNSLVVEKFVDEYDYVPLSLREVEIFAKSKNKKFYIYDNSGNRIAYYPLGVRDWLLRSFGEDGGKSSLLAPKDLVRTSPGLRKTKGVRYQGGVGEHLFPAVLAEGSWSADYYLLAHIYEHPYTGTRRLVVSQPENRSQVWIAPHPYVEEFYWLDGMKEIIYTAGNYGSRASGLYIWNLRSNRSQKLRLPGDDDLHLATSRGPMFYALMGVDPQHHQLRVRAHRLYAVDHDLDRFWRDPAYLHVYDFKQQKWLAPSLQESLPQNMHQAALFCETQVQMHLRGVFWCQQDLQRRYDEVITGWQQYVMEAEGAPSKMATLFALAQMYRSVLSRADLPADQRTFVQALLHEIVLTMKESDFMTAWQSVMLDHLLLERAQIDWYPQLRLE